jgi:hypothetical protein
MGSGLIPVGFESPPLLRRAPKREYSGAQFGPYHHYMEMGITGMPTIFWNLAL